MDFYYDGMWRMDWSLGNPNKTATLIACLIIATWCIPLVWRPGFYFALIASTLLAWCLVQTYSRGGVVSLLAGMGVLVAAARRPWPKSRWVAVMASLWICLGFAIYAKAQTRYSQGLFTEDQSIANRLVIWRHVPEMMAAAPWGWGWGKAGDSYTQWFQPFSQSQNYLNLVNSHFTWMVEGGWVTSVGYLFAWLIIFLLCRPIPSSRLKAIPLAIWVTFGVGGCFSHVEESIWLWILPLVALGFVIVGRFHLRQWPPLSSFVWGGAFSFVVVATLILVGRADPSLPMSLNGGAVTVGTGPAHTLIFIDRQVMGSLYGHTFRRFLAAQPDQLSTATFTFFESSRIPPSPDLACLVISGKFMQEDAIVSHLGQGQRVILVNPSCFPGEAKLNGDLIARTLVYFGEYSQASSRSAWSTYPGIRAFQIGGASDFVPSWPQTIFNPGKT